MLKFFLLFLWIGIEEAGVIKDLIFFRLIRKGGSSYSFIDLCFYVEYLVLFKDR